MKKTKKFKPLRLIWLVLKIVLALHIIFLLSGAIAIFSIKYINPKFTSLSLYRKYVQKVDNKPFEYIPMSELSRSLKRGVIRLEDASFREHSGIDFDAIVTAYKLNKKYKRRVSGGSTITQQLVRTLFLLTDKNYLRKYLEALLALEMELILSKNRILELYINYIEFGKGVYGIGSASRHYYNKDARKLNAEQMARLLIILPSPIKYGPKDIHRKSFFRKRSRILANDPAFSPYIQD